jgi:hypothetical protein
MICILSQANPATSTTHILLKTILILFCYLYLGLPSSTFSSDFPRNI